MTVVQILSYEHYLQCTWLHINIALGSLPTLKWSFFSIIHKIALSMLVLSFCGEKKKHTETVCYLLIQEYFAISALKYLPREKSAGISCHNHFVKMVFGTSR